MVIRINAIVLSCEVARGRKRLRQIKSQNSSRYDRTKLPDALVGQMPAIG